MKKIVLLLTLLASFGGVSLSWAGEASSPQLMPHKALYKVTLVKAKPSAGLHEVGGTMIFDMADVCDGWTVHQYMKMKFAYDEGDEDDVASSIVTWEGKDSKAMVFQVKRVTSGKTDEGYKGRAMLTDKEGTAHYSYPLDKEDIVFPASSLFPIAHTSMIIAKAKAGEKLFSRRVFDGSDAAGSAEVSAFIAARSDNVGMADMDEELRNDDLIKGKAVWPVRLAFYPPEGQASEPDYEMELDLQENGIARSMVIDYGNFSIAGTLVKIEDADPVTCSDKK